MAILGGVLAERTHWMNPARGSEREVLRSAAGPELAVSSAVSPLAEYRGLFEDDRADDVLFTVTADGALPDRVRLATRWSACRSINLQSTMPWDSWG